MSYFFVTESPLTRTLALAASSFPLQHFADFLEHSSNHVLLSHSGTPFYVEDRYLLLNSKTCASLRSGSPEVFPFRYPATHERQPGSAHTPWFLPGT
ncbi:MAG: hypothetical protein GF344_17260 [Chitinivibrionales bacterium]|nr:hypothetical protein [Chitinivibrionales bacterium]MBD3358420.1 hypothetical protein [Chitinivibrionales bacterium]